MTDLLWFVLLWWWLHAQQENPKQQLAPSESEELQMGKEPACSTYRVEKVNPQHLVKTPIFLKINKKSKEKKKSYFLTIGTPMGHTHP